MRGAAATSRAKRECAQEGTHLREGPSTQGQERVWLWTSRNSLRCFSQRCSTAARRQLATRTLPTGCSVPPWRGALLALPYAAGSCATGVDIAREPGGDGPSSAMPSVLLQHPLLTKPNVVPADKGEAFTGCSSNIPKHAHHGGFGAERQYTDNQHTNDGQWEYRCWLYYFSFKALRIKVLNDYKLKNFLNDILKLTSNEIKTSSRTLGKKSKRDSGDQKIRISERKNKT